MLSINCSIWRCLLYWTWWYFVVVCQIWPWGIFRFMFSPGFGSELSPNQVVLMSWKLPDLFWLYVMMWNKMVRVNVWCFCCHSKRSQWHFVIELCDRVLSCFRVVKSILSSVFFSGSNGFSSDFIRDFLDGPSGLDGIQLWPTTRSAQMSSWWMRTCKMLEIGKSTNYNPPINCLSGIYHGKPLQNYKTYINIYILGVW